MVYLAHLDAEDGREQSIPDHSVGTADLAGEFAAVFSARRIGYLCGLLHDIGKYSLKFQRRIRNSGEKVDHSTAGAKVAAQELRDIPIAFCIAGHHGGLPDLGNRRFDTPDSPTLAGKLKRKVGEDIEDYSVFREEITYSPAPHPEHLIADPVGRFFYVRMLYSCLVDADYLDTENFMKKGAVERGGYSSLPELYAKLEEYIAPWWNSENPLNQRRCEILSALIKAGALPKGLFSLTVPTGGGKTVSSIAFSLCQAIQNGQRRIIYVIPYTSIIEQTQEVFERIFGPENVVAHYATLDYATDEYGQVTDRRYLATENWDAPIILTTAVQFFESLYANRSSRCRKLHNIAGSVIVLDEAQMLPVPYLAPCISALSQLVGRYDCSAVLCTATQPALSPLFAKYLPGVPITELCPNPAGMYDFFQRVKFQLPGMMDNEALAHQLLQEEQVLCIVNSRRQAQAIFTLLGEEDSFHLSTTMYPAHRRQVLVEIRHRLEEGIPCRVISTSLVEAGVDVDFPTVYRALAGLDSMIQAAGRCNRENKRKPSESIVYLFETPQSPPDALRQNISAAQRVLRTHEDLASPQAVQDYFNFLYYRLKDESDLDNQGILKDIEADTMPFASVAERFHIIGSNTCTLYIPLGEGKELVEQLEKVGPSRSLLRRLGLYSVEVYPWHLEELLSSGGAKRIAQNAAILCDTSLYSEKTGLSFAARWGEALMT